MRVDMRVWQSQFKETKFIDWYHQSQFNQDTSEKLTNMTKWVDIPEQQQKQTFKMDRPPI